LQLYVHNRIHCSPRTWDATATEIASADIFLNKTNDVKLYGIWRSQIGLPRDTITIISLWQRLEAIDETLNQVFRSINSIKNVETNIMVPTVRPETPIPPVMQGNYAFRWFETPKENFNEFIRLCAEAWPNFEKNYNSEIIGLWKLCDKVNDNIQTLLLTRRPNLAMWERSKIPLTDEEKEVRRKLSKRYDLCSWTNVYTTTLLTANDVSDTVRWS
tara:strand:- start:2826 stop:3473 length:648 start_codon:yes stop_codon:yes gene_type:complete